MTPSTTLSLLQALTAINPIDQGYEEMTETPLMTRKEMRSYAAGQMLRLRFDDWHQTVVAEDKRTGVLVWRGPIYELIERIRSGEVI